MQNFIIDVKGKADATLEDNDVTLGDGPTLFSATAAPPSSSTPKLMT